MSCFTVICSACFAARAYFTLDYLGHGSNVSLLDGGLESGPKEHGTVRTIPGILSRPP